MVCLEGHSTILYNGTLFVFGGRDNTAGFLQNTVWACSVAEATAAHTPHVTFREVAIKGDYVPPPRAYHAATLRGTFMVVVGGVTDIPPDTPEGHLRMFSLNLETFQWLCYDLPSTTPSCPGNMCHSSLISTPDAILLFGGFPLNGGDHVTTDGPRRSLWSVYEVGASGSVKAITPPETERPLIWGHSAVCLSDNAVVFGGVDVQHSMELNSMAIFSSVDRKWKWAEFPKVPWARALHTAIVDRGKMVIFGGFTGAPTLSTEPHYADTWAFSLHAGVWDELKCSGTLPYPRSGHTATLVGTKMVVVAGLESHLPTADGACDPRCRHVSSVATLDLDTHAWTQKAAFFLKNGQSLDDVASISSGQQSPMLRSPTSELVHQNSYPNPVYSFQSDPTLSNNTFNFPSNPSFADDRGFNATPQFPRPTSPIGDTDRGRLSPGPRQSPHPPAGPHRSGATSPSPAAFDVGNIPPSPLYVAGGDRGSQSAPQESQQFTSITTELGGSRSRQRSQEHSSSVAKGSGAFSQLDSGFAVPPVVPSDPRQGHSRQPSAPERDADDLELPSFMQGIAKRFGTAHTEPAATRRSASQSAVGSPSPTANTDFEPSPLRSWGGLLSTLSAATAFSSTAPPSASSSSARPSPDKRLPTDDKVSSDPSESEPDESEQELFAGRDVKTHVGTAPPSRTSIPPGSPVIVPPGFRPSAVETVSTPPSVMPKVSSRPANETPLPPPAEARKFSDGAVSPPRAAPSAEALQWYQKRAALNPV